MIEDLEIKAALIENELRSLPWNTSEPMAERCARIIYTIAEDQTRSMVSLRDALASPFNCPKVVDRAIYLARIAAGKSVQAMLLGGIHTPTSDDDTQVERLERELDKPVPFHMHSSQRV